VYRIFGALGTRGERAVVAGRRILAAPRRAPLNRTRANTAPEPPAGVRRAVTVGRSGAE